MLTWQQMQFTIHNSNFQGMFMPNSLGFCFHNTYILLLIYFQIVLTLCSDEYVNSF